MVNRILTITNRRRSNMCLGGSRPAPQPVAPPPVSSVQSPDEQAPELEIAGEDTAEVAAKKKKKTGTNMLQTDVNTSGTGVSNVSIPTV